MEPEASTPDAGEAATLPANIVEDVLSSQRTLRADEVRALESGPTQVPSTPSVLPAPLRSAIPPPPSEPGVFAEPTPWRASFDSASEVPQGFVDRVARFIAERPGLVIGGASAIAGALLVGAVIVVAVTSEPQAQADEVALTEAPTPASATSAAAPPASEEAAPSASAAPAGAAAAASGQLEVSADAPIARVRIGKRVVDMEVPAPNVAVDLTPEERTRTISISVTSTDGRIASAMWAPGDPPLALAFGEAPATRPLGKPGAKAGASKPRSKAPRR